MRHTSATFAQVLSHRMIRHLMQVLHIKKNRTNKSEKSRFGVSKACKVIPTKENYTDNEDDKVREDKFKRKASQVNIVSTNQLKRLKVLFDSSFEESSSEDSDAVDDKYSRNDEKMKIS
jgi:hypothetical protein